VFLLALGAAPFLLRRSRRYFREPWMALFIGVSLMGGVMLLAAMTVVAPDYVAYVMFVQIILAAGLLTLADEIFPERKRWLHFALAGCAILISIRAAGITTWGVACAWKNSYGTTQNILRTELEPFAKTNTPVIISSAFLYRALALEVQRPIHPDWYYNHATATADSDIEALKKLRPTKLVLTQFDYYRGIAPVLERLRQETDSVEITVRDQAQLRPPDAIPALSRVVQHISWAPLIVDLNWK